MASDSGDDEPYPSLRPLTQRQIAPMLATVEQHIKTSEKNVIDKLEELHAATSKEIAELRQLMLTKHDEMAASNAAMAASIEALGGLFVVPPSGAFSQGPV